MLNYPLLYIALRDFAPAGHTALRKGRIRTGAVKSVTPFVLHGLCSGAVAGRPVALPLRGMPSLSGAGVAFTAYRCPTATGWRALPPSCMQPRQQEGRIAALAGRLPDHLFECQHEDVFGADRLELLDLVPKLLLADHHVHRTPALLRERQDRRALHAG